MLITESKILKLKIIQPITNHEDFRGTYTEIYNEYEFIKNNIDIKFIQDDYSFSNKNVIRGIHGDSKTTKLISCLYGSFYLVVVDVRPDSETYLKWEGFTLSSINKLSILIPPHFGNGHLVLSNDGAIFHYKQSTVYDRSGQFTLNWRDRRLNIYWPIEFPILSERDSGPSTI